MAVSDNVLNAAFMPQPPPEDRWQVRAFLDALTYTSRPASHWLLPHTRFAQSRNSRTAVYDPPEAEFSVLGTSLRARPAEDTEELAPNNGPLVGIVTRGEVRVKVGEEQMELRKGGVVFVRPGHAVEVKLSKAQVAREEEGGEIWWAACLV